MKRLRARSSSPVTPAAARADSIPPERHTGALQLQEARLRRVFHRVLLLCLATPPAYVACKSEEGAPEADAGVADAALSDAPGDQYMSLFPDVGVDSFVAWCEAGPPELAEAGPCNDYYFVPCGLPPGVVYISSMGDLTGCAELCPDATGQVQGCEVVQPADAAVDAAASLPESGTPVTVVCTLCQPGRKPAGLRQAPVYGRGNAVASYWIQAAHLEAASVCAFKRLRDELRSLGAPTSLARAAERAGRDEIRHARIAERFARAALARAGMLVRPRVDAPRPRSMEAVAVENMVEGCVRETFSALIATWQARHARDPRVAAAMARIAADETRHAALAWAVARFLDRGLHPRARARVARARRAAARAITHEARLEQNPDLVRLLGLPPRAAAERLARGLAATVWS